MTTATLPGPAAPAPKTSRTPAHRKNTHNRGEHFELVWYEPADIKVLFDQIDANITTPSRRVSPHINRLANERLRGMIIVAWRTGMRISELLDLREGDLRPEEQAIRIRRGKGGKARTVRMEAWGWSQLDRWLHLRADLPPGYLFPVVKVSAAGNRLSYSEAAQALRALARKAGMRKRANWHSFRHTFAVESVFKEGISPVALMRQLGHVDLRVTTRYLNSIDSMFATQPIAERAAPVIPLV